MENMFTVIHSKTFIILYIESLQIIYFMLIIVRQ